MKVVAESAATYITLEWAASADTQLPVIGYALSMKDNSKGLDEYTMVYNGSGYPNVRKYTVASSLVKQGYTYTFKAQAINFNGLGTASTPVEYIICVAPTGLAAPFLAAVTQLNMTMSWATPAADGGCPILSYSLFKDDGAGGTLVEVDAASVNNLPTLRAHQVTSFTSGDTGKTYRYQMKATNIIGTVVSDEISWVLAAVPDQPTGPPTINYTGTSTTRIQADYPAFSTSMNGGSAVLSYELEIYDYDASQWKSLVGGNGTFTLAASFTAEGLERGRIYMFRYRAWNVNGGGSYSPIAHLLAASPPAQVPQPQYGASTTSSITVLLQPTPDDGGAMVTRMELEKSAHLADTWANVTTYDGTSLTHTLTTATDGLVAHTKYRFRVRAINSHGVSEYSLQLIVSTAPLPSKFSVVIKDQVYSSTTTIMVRWSDPAGEVEPILGYRLLMTDMNTNQSAAEINTTVYDNPTNEDVREKHVTGLTPGGLYEFRVLGYNFNGAGE